MDATSTGKIAVLDVFRELRAVVSGEEGKTCIRRDPLVALL
jgi:hypothetical protein